jgi:hypothetical protein
MSYAARYCDYQCDFTRNFAASELIILPQKPSFEHEVGNEIEEILRSLPP